MGLEEAELVDDDDSIIAKSLMSSNVSCSICLELVIFNNGRSCVKLICGHEFHLDCIGSAFNSRGSMQCPNCRNVEKGQWLYGSGGPVCDDPHDAEFYDLSYSEMSFGVRWCPFTFPQLPSSFDEGEFSPTVYHDLLGQHAVYTEHAPVSSTSYPYPYFAYYGPVHHSSSPNSSSNNHWSGPNPTHTATEVQSSYASMDPHFASWEHQEHHHPSAPQRSSRPNSDPSRPDFFLHPFLVAHSSRNRGSNNSVSQMIPPYPGAAPRNGEHVQPYLQLPNHSPPGRRPFNQPPSRRHFLSNGLSTNRRSTIHRTPSSSSSSSSSLASSSDQSPGYYIFPEADNQMPSRSSFHPWERDRFSSLFPPFNQAADREPAWGPIHASGPTTFRPPQSRD